MRESAAVNKVVIFLRTALKVKANCDLRLLNSLVVFTDSLFIFLSAVVCLCVANLQNNKFTENH